MFARLGFYYRRSLGEVLLKQRGNPMSGELICDPFLATFPIVAEQLDVMDLVRSLWVEKLKSYGNKKREESEETAHFREVYVNTAFVLYDVIPMPEFDPAEPSGTC
uniref:Nephrocystin-1 n=1 Tax=Ascaris suum TaxID=6253 RepID=F1L5K4_ASCSU